MGIAAADPCAPSHPRVLRAAGIAATKLRWCCRTSIGVLYCGVIEVGHIDLLAGSADAVEHSVGIANFL